MAPKAAISYTVIILGLGFYYVALTSLISARTAIVDRQVIFEGIDKNKDGKLSSKEIDAFNPCQTDFDNLNIKLHKLGNKISSKKFNSQISDSLIKKTLAQCVSQTSDMINPAKLWKKDNEEASEQFFGLYDLNRDGVVAYKEYHSINSYNKKPLKNQKQTFSFLDRNTDWRITPKEFAKVKLQKIKPKKE